MKTMLKAVGIIALIAVICLAVSCGGGGNGGGNGPTIIPLDGSNGDGGGPAAASPSGGPASGAPETGVPESPGSEPVPELESMIEMVSIPAGSFWMGRPDSEPSNVSDETQHEVTLTKGFKMGEYSVTQKQWEEVMGVDACLTLVRGSTYGVGDDYPMYYVSWYDALVFCNKLSMMEDLTPAYKIGGSTDPDAWGVVPTTSNAVWNAVEIAAGSDGYRLPTEAQWEYACRGDYANKDIEKKTKPFGIGDGTKITGDMANLDGTAPYDKSKDGQYPDGTGSKSYKSKPVGSYAPNNYGLYDMHGNVLEWCWDRWNGSDYSGAAEIDPEGAAVATTARVNRGGYWGFGGMFLRSACRNRQAPYFRHHSIGFRLVRP